MASASSSRDPKELYILKQKAMKYYQENGVPAKMEEILNSMFYDAPPDVYGHLVNYFSQFTKPAVLRKMTAMKVFDACGMPTLQTDVYCTVNNKEKFINSSTIPSANIKVRPEEREKAELELHDSIVAAVNLINSGLSLELTGMDPLQQAEIDGQVLAVLEKLKEEYLAKKAQDEENKEDASPPPPPAEDKDKKKSAKKPGKNSAPIPIIPDRPLEVFVAGSEAVAAVSQAVCACAATAHHIPLYRHVSNISRMKGAVHQFRIPLPMVTIIQSGKLAPGKSNCIKEYMVVPGIGMPIDKSIEHIQHIYNHVSKSFVSKLGASAKFVNENGALCPAMDTPTQALDLLQEAVNAQGLTIGEDMHLAINAAAHEYFDYEKGKFEIITGQLKSTDDMVDFWADLLSKYPSIIAIIDPLRGQNADAWMSLCERVSEMVYIVGDHYYERPGLLKKEELPNPVRSSGLLMYLERMNSVSDIISCANKFQDASNEIIIATNQGDTSDTFIVDLAVGLNARFLKLGGPCRGERSSKLNRLLQIFSELAPPEPLTGELDASNDQSQGEGDGKKDAVIKEEEEGDETTELTVEDISIPNEDENEVQKEERWGENEKSCLHPHTAFIFPLIQNPPPPEDLEEDGEKVEKVASPTSKRSK